MVAILFTNFARSTRNANLRFDSKINPADKMTLRDWLVSFESATPTDHSIIVWWARHPNYVNNKLPTINNYEARQGRLVAQRVTDRKKRNDTWFEQPQRA